MNEEVNNVQPEIENAQETVKVSDWKKKFISSEKLMKSEFLPKYQLAKTRLRAEYEVKRRGQAKMTNEQVSLVYSIGSNFVNSVYYKSPQCNLTAREEVEHEKVENTEVAVNDWLKDKKAKKVIKRCIWDAYTGGFGSVFIDYEYMDTPSNEPLMEVQSIPLANGQIVQQPSPVLDEQGQPRMKPIVLKNEVTIQRIRPDLLRFPRGFDFDNYQDSPWIGFDLILPIEEIKANESWDQEARELIKGERYEKLSAFDKQSAKSGNDEDLYGKISYAFIKPSNPKVEPFKLLVFCQEYEQKELLYSDFSKGHVGYPIKPIYFNPLDDDCPYPNGDPWMFESQLSAVDEWWRKVVSHVKRSNPKTVYDSGVISQAEASKLKSNNDNELVGIENKLRIPLGNLIQEINAPRVNSDLDKMWEVARQLVSEIAPKTSLSAGAGKSTNTATEAKIMQVGENIDVDARIDDVSDFIKDIVLDVAGIYEKSLAAPIQLNKENPETGEKYFDSVGSEGFTSKINIDVDVESMQAQNKDVIRRQLIDAIGLFQNLQAFFMAAGIAPDPKFWIQKLMDTMNIRNVEKGFIPIQPPILPQQQNNQGPPVPTEGNRPNSGLMPPEAVEAGLAQRT